MGTKVNAVALLILAFSLISASRSHAGTDMVIDNSAQAPPPTYYAPPPPRVVYYAPPPVRVIVQPTYAYYARPVRVFGYHRAYGHRRHCR